MLVCGLIAAPGIEVVADSPDVPHARREIIHHRPDVIVLDLELPGTDGLTFLEELREYYPVPVIVCSGTTRHGGPRALRALELGAMEVLIKPEAGGRDATAALLKELARLVRVAASGARPVVHAEPEPTGAGPSFRSTGIDPSRWLIAIGASTGGTEAIRTFLTALPKDGPPIVIVQHMPVSFTASFADRLNALTGLEVAEATDGESLVPGRALVARGDRHLVVVGTVGNWTVRYTHGDPVGFHCPAVNELFHSVAEKAGPRSIGILLTGMGRDGAEGLLAMREAGAITLAQDRESCVVYGMPRVAEQLGAVQLRGRPEQIPFLLLARLRRRKSLEIAYNRQHST